MTYHVGIELECEGKGRVAVTGANGFIASWIVKLLLQRGYYVRGTVRDPDNMVKTAHLRNFDGAKDRLELVKADILDYPSIGKAVEGCQGVFHTACPVTDDITDPHTQMIKPAVEGSTNVMVACAHANVRRVVMTSSVGAVYMDPERPVEQVIDESCWSNLNHLNDIKEWYCLAKTMAEKVAWGCAETHNMDLVTICPPVTMGTMLHAGLNQSSTHILKYLTGSARTYANRCQAYLNVKDAAEAHVLAYETPSASGRYICAPWSMHRGELVETLAEMYPQYPIPTKCKDETQPRKAPLKFSTNKVQELGLQFTSFKQTLADAVASLVEKGAIQSPQEST